MWLMSERFSCGTEIIIGPVCAGYHMYLACKAWLHFNADSKTSETCFLKTKFQKTC